MAQPKAQPKPPVVDEELTPEQRKFLEQKRAQQATTGEHRSDQGAYLKSGRQQKQEKKEEIKAAREAARVPPQPMTRREFLNYAWGAATAVLLVEAGIASFMFALPRFKEGEFGGLFPLGPITGMPSPDAPPVRNLEGQFWLSSDADGIRALYRVCTHLGCLYEWKDQTFRFECPCHGSKFQKNGVYIEGPAPRSLDQFVILLRKNGEVIAQTTAGGQAVKSDDPAVEVVVDTGKKLNGPPH